MMLTKKLREKICATHECDAVTTTGDGLVYMKFTTSNENNGKWLFVALSLGDLLSMEANREKGKSNPRV